MGTKELEDGTVVDDNEGVAEDQELGTTDETTSDDDTTDESKAEKEGLSVTIGETNEDESDEAEFHGPAPQWVKDMRKQNREQRKRLRQLEQELATKSQAQSQQQPLIELGEKPTLEKAEYDSVRYEKELAEWFEKKKALDDQRARAKAQEEEQQKQWKERISMYERDKLVLHADDYDDAEAVIREHLDVVQQGIIVQGAKNAALMIYALGKNPDKAQMLGAIKDPVRFAFAVGRLEAQLKVNDKKPAVPPEGKVIGSARTTGSADVTLERLRAEAAKTGDYSKVTAYKRKLKAQQPRR